MMEGRHEHGRGANERWVLPRVTSVWWSRGAVLCTMALGVLIVAMQTRQAERTKEAFASTREMREARLDLSKGFLHLTQAGAANMPYAREQGLALLAQATKRLEQKSRAMDGGAAAEEFAEHVRVFHEYVDTWTDDTTGDAGAAADMRAAFYRLERDADALGWRWQGRLENLEKANRREFLWVAAAAAGLLAVFCVAMIRVQGVRMRIERELRERESRFRRVAESLPQLVWTWTPDGRCDYLSQRWLDYTGREEAAQLGHGWAGQIHPEDGEMFAGVAREAMANGIEFHAQVRLRRHDGVYRWFDTRVVPLHGEDGSILQWLGSQTDIQADRELREAAENERNFSDAMIDSLPGVFYLYDDKGKFLRWNRNFERATGYTGAEIAAMSPLDFFEGDERARVQARIGDVFRTGQSEVEAEFLAKDGRATPYFFTGMTTTLNGRTCLVGVGIDIRQRKQAENEVRALNATLEQRVAQRTAELQAKNRELETFTYSVSHDLKAPLRGIDGYSRLLLEDYADKLDDEGRRFLNSVRQASTQMGQLIDDLLAYSQLERRKVSMVPVKPRAVLDSLPVGYADEIRDRGVKFTVALPDTEVLADTQGLAQVLRNLIDNALKFTRGAAAPQIEVAGRVEGGKALLWVRDNGIGFDMKFTDRIFDIFQRLHRSEDYPGTGIGLAIVRKAMERMNGRVWAESTPGNGATFYLEIPNHQP